MVEDPRILARWFGEEPMAKLLAIIPDNEVGYLCNTLWDLMNERLGQTILEVWIEEGVVQRRRVSILSVIHYVVYRAIKIGVHGKDLRFKCKPIIDRWCQESCSAGFTLKQLMDTLEASTTWGSR